MAPDGNPVSEPSDDAPEVEESVVLAVAVELARLRVDETSLRHVAREIGMSPTGLRGLLDGADPYGKTKEKMRAWYVRMRGLSGVSPEVAENTILALLRSIPDPHRVASELLDFVEGLHRKRDLRVPTWIPEARARVAHSVRRLHG